MQLHIYPTKEELAQNFAAHLAQIVARKEEVHLALSGGSTPKVLFRALSKHYVKTIDWSRVHLYWGDERLVPPTDEESNYKMAADNLLDCIPIPEIQVNRIRGEEQPVKEAQRYSAILQENLPQVNSTPRFDLVILGMGDDGHTASIFPDSIRLWEAKENCVVVSHPETGQKRITITGQVINNAREVAFLVTGESKSEKVRQIIRQEDGYRAYPAALVDPLDGSLGWYLDKEAAAGLISVQF
jgi:6-phosphogluconolactonase